MKTTFRLRALLSASIVLPMALAADTTKPAAQTAVAPKPRPQIEVCFVLDTTGSMGGLIEGAKQKIWSIANDIIRAKPTPELKIGLIGYRDRGDAYVIKAFALTNDIDVIYGHLQAFQAQGGGDTPESVNEALHEAVTRMPWSKERDVLKIIFLVGDAPPHMDYTNSPKYPDVCKEAAKRDLIINTVQCGNYAETVAVWKEIASLAEGAYAAIAQSGNMVAIATPMDEELASLNRKLGRTLVAYGGVSQRRALAAKQVASESAPASVAADRLSFNARYGVAVQGGGELLDALGSGEVKLESVKRADLPDDLQKLPDAELKSEVEKRQKDRAGIQSRIRDLNQQRERYVAAERKRQASENKGDSFDEKVAQTIRQQAAAKGIDYGK